MRIRLSLLLLVSVLVTACTPIGTPPSAPPTAASATQPAVSEPTAEATLDYSSAETAGRSFLEAWEAKDYATMYGLLSPALRAGLAEADFRNAYQVPLYSTTTISVTTLPTKLGIDNNTAWIEFNVVWHTGIFGELRANNRMDLVRTDGQWWIEWNKGTIWPELGAGYAFGAEYEIPPRANIYDREGAGLAVPTTLVTVGIIPGQIEDEAALLAQLSVAIDVPAEEIRADYANQPATWYIPVADITLERQQLYSAALSLPGIELRERSSRLYPLEGTGAHVVGWVAPIPEESYETYRQLGYRGDERVGVAGLEAWGETALAGKNGGRLYLINAEGDFAGTLAQRVAERSRPLYTTLDRLLQQAAETALG